MANQVAVIDTAREYDRDTHTREDLSIRRSCPRTARRCMSATGAAESRDRRITDGMFRSSSIRGPASERGTVSVIDTASNTVVKTINVGLHPTGLALSAAGDRVRDQRQRHRLRINTATDTVVKTLHVSGAATRIAARQLAECRRRHAERAAVRGERIAERGCHG